MNNRAAQEYCAFCGLPVAPMPSLTSDPASLDDVYCCTGCRMVAGVEEAKAAEGDSAKAFLKLGLGVFFAMNVMVFTMALWSYDVYPRESFETSLANVLRGVFRWASMLFSLPVLWLLGDPIVRSARQSLRRGAMTADLLILLGVSAAYVYSAASVIRNAGHVYFEVGVMVLIFVSLGRWLEAKGKRRTTESLDRLANLLPDAVHRLSQSGEFVDVPRESLRSGDVIRILPGERIPVDGEIIEGQSSIDEQLVSGESIPRFRSLGDAIYSGTLNHDGDLRVRVTGVSGQETLSRMIALVREARREKGRQQQLADRIAFWFVPVVAVVAIAAGTMRGLSVGIDQGILTSLSVVLIACPCALGLATPLAQWTALGRAAEHGVLFRSGQVLEQLARVRTACFDKTGTLTTGSPQLVEVVSLHNEDRTQLLQRAATVASGSNHPLSQAILATAKEQVQASGRTSAPTVKSIPGKGVTADADFGRTYLGSQQFMNDAGLSWPVQPVSNQMTNSAEPRVFIGWSGYVQGAFCFEEMVRPHAVEAVGMCRQLNLELKVLTGDQPSRATKLSKILGISYDANQLPGDKLTTVKSLRQHGAVAMIGDGMNDAPALAAADVGVALGCGADISRETAGVCLVSDDLRCFPWAIALARRANRVVMQNLFWAFAYNSIGIGLAATGRLNPILAAAAMAISSLLAIANSLRLGQFRDIEGASEAGLGGLGTAPVTHHGSHAPRPQKETHPEMAAIAT